ncbi:TPA: hypothetical protein OME38_004605 [Klebsiella oxytoca]|nr:hypothetical protein [Klebsiella oxytoca]
MEDQKRPVLTLKHRRDNNTPENNETRLLLVGKKRQYVNNAGERKCAAPVTEKKKKPQKVKQPAAEKAVKKDKTTPRNQKAKPPGKSKTRRHNEYVKRKINDVFSHFPVFAESAGPLPLAINIHIQMMEYVNENNIPVTEAQVMKAIKYYVLQKTYHLAIIKYNWRRDISGNKTTQITKEEKAYAIKKLEVK